MHACAHYAATAAAVPTTQAPVPPKPTRKQSIDPEAAQKLEKSLAQRPDKHELIERNILKGGIDARARS